MGHVTKERHWSNNYQHLFINWEAKEIDHSIFIKACKDFANVLSDTRVSEKYVDSVITACSFTPVKWTRQVVFIEKEKKHPLRSWCCCLYPQRLLNIKSSHFVDKHFFQTPGQDVSMPRDSQHFLKSLRIGSLVNPFTSYGNQLQNNERRFNSKAARAT